MGTKNADTEQVAENEFKMNEDIINSMFSEEIQEEENIIKEEGADEPKEEKKEEEKKEEEKKEDTQEESSKEGYKIDDVVPDMPDDIFSDDDEKKGDPDQEEESRIPDTDEDLEEEEEELTKDFNEKQRHAFAKVKHDRKELRDKLREKEKKLQELADNPLGTNSEIQAKLKRLEQELVSKDKEIAAIDLSKSEVFKKQHNEPIQAKVAQIIKYLMEDGHNRESASKLALGIKDMKLRDRARRIAEESPLFNGAIVNLYNEVDELSARRAMALRNAEGTRASLNESQMRSNEEKRIASLEGAVGSAVSKMRQQNNYLYKASKHDTEKAKQWNNGVFGRIGMIKSVLEKNNPEEIAEYVADGITGRLVRGEMNILRKENQELRETNKRLGGKSDTGPKLSSNSGVSSKDIKEQKKEVSGTNEDIVNQILGNDFDGIRI